MADAPFTSLDVFHGLQTDFIRNSLPPWLKDTTPERLRVLKSVGLKSAAPYPDATAEQHQKTRQAVGDHWHALNHLDQQFQGLEDIHAYAEALLKAELRDYGDIDVRNTFVRLYVSTAKAWWVHDLNKAVTSRTPSLLEAALHNFAEGDAFVDYAFLSGPAAGGQQRVLRFHHRATGALLTIEVFKRLCRSLDIGARYRRHLKTVLGFYNHDVARTLRLQVIASQKTALTAAAHLARLKGDLRQDALDVLLALVANPDAPLRLDDRPLGCYTLDMINTRLTGIILLCASPQPEQPLGRIIAYVPDDPEHPLKEYPSATLLLDELTRQLRDVSVYQVFFSRFVAHEQRGEFFARLNERLSQVNGRRSANLQLRVQPYEEDYQNRSDLSTHNDLWNYRYRVQLNKSLNDARHIAISTRQADRMARWAWWDNLEKMLADILNVALQVLTPLVPGLGEVMLAYTAYQLTDEVFEGIVDWAQGDAREAADHLFGVAENIIQIGIFEAAGRIGQHLQLKLSGRVEGLRQVELPDGRRRLWNPDISAYASPHIQLPADAPATPSGLHTHQGQQVLRRDGKHFQVLHDTASGEHRIVHPLRPDAYRPKVRLNGHGAVVHEGEQPQAWDKATLMRRLGPRAEVFSDGQLEQIRQISGSSEDVLRGLYQLNEAPPPLLADTLNRFEAYASAEQASAQIRAGAPLAEDAVSAWFEQTITELDGWPQDKAIEVFLHSSLQGDSHKYGNVAAAPVDTLALSLAEVMSGRLPERVLGFLDEASTRQLLGQPVAREHQVQHLRDRLADYVTRQKPDIGRYVHQLRELSDQPGVCLLRQSFAHLDTTVAQTIVDTAGSAEREQMQAEGRLPLRLENLARELAFVVDTTHAYEGLVLPWRQTPASERLLLNTLKRHSDVFADLHLQIREQTADGSLRCEAGPTHASVLRILVHKGNLGYEVLDGLHTRLHGSTTLYESILNALPFEQRQSLGFARGQGAGLRHWLLETLEPLGERRAVLAEPPVRAEADRQTLSLLGKPMPGRALLREENLHKEALKTLFRYHSEERIEAFMRRIGAEHIKAKINQLVTEHFRLHEDLAQWRRMSGRHASAAELELREHIEAQILFCWEDQIQLDSNQPGSLLDLSGLDLPDPLPTLRVDFSHVAELNLGKSRVGASHAEFLGHFPNLRRLDLSESGVAQLPEPVRQMRHLEHLDLSHNRLALRTLDITRLKNLRYLRRLKLNNTHNPRAPDIGRMRDLEYLDVSHSPLSHWPDGLFDVPRPDGFFLNLQGTAITHVPDVAPGGPEATLIARARLDRRSLSAVQRDRFKLYRESVGLDPERTYEPQGHSAPWLEYMSPQAREQARRIWTQIEHEHGSQGLFEVIKALERPEFFETVADEDRYNANHRVLTGQVWDLLETAAVDTTLRQKLMEMASFPANCPDAGTQLFNELGIEVLINHIERYTPAGPEQERQLATVCKGHARIGQLNDVVRADIAHRLRPLNQGGLGQRLRTQVVDGVAGEVDEVEIYLAYQTSLAQRLDLPWISDHMLYRRTANVTDEQIEGAYNQVLELGAGDGLVNRMLLEPHWRAWLETHYRAQYDEHQQQLKHRHEQLYELQELREQWQQSAEGLHKEPLKKQLLQLADHLDIAHAMALGKDDEFHAACEKAEDDLGDKAQAWMRERTRIALASTEGLSNRP